MKYFGAFPSYFNEFECYNELIYMCINNSLLKVAVLGRF